MAQGCPIVATAVGGINETLEEGRNALLIPTDNPEALAESCLTLMGDKALASRLGKQARLDCAAKFSPQSIARTTVEFYAKVLGAGRPASEKSILLSAQVE
jgi:glycosyltransferase involved in cell wall biosynthesis